MDGDAEPPFRFSVKSRRKMRRCAGGREVKRKVPSQARRSKEDWVLANAAMVGRGICGPPALLHQGARAGLWQLW